MKIHTTDNKAGTDTMAIFQCESDREVRWYFKEVHMDNLIHTGYNMLIDPVLAQNEGMYYCMATRDGEVYYAKQELILDSN